MADTTPTSASASAGNAATDTRQLPRLLGLFAATMIVVGSIIGAGILLKVNAGDEKLQP